MKHGQRICITPSIALTELKLDKLAGRYAIINEIKTSANGNVKGCWVMLEGLPYEGEQEWYIPFSSIVE